MKMLIFTLATLIFYTTTFAQTVSLEPVAQRYVQSNYTVAEELALKDSPEQIECLNFVFSQSFAFTKDQMVLKSQRALFNIERYKHLRKTDSRVIVYDEVTGLTVELLSYNEVDKALDAIHSKYNLATK